MLCVYIYSCIIDIVDHVTKPMIDNPLIEELNSGMYIHCSLKLKRAFLFTFATESDNKPIH